MLRIEIVGGFEPQVFQPNEAELDEIFNERVRIHSRSLGFTQALNVYGALLNEGIRNNTLELNDLEMYAYFEIRRVYASGGSVVFHRD